MVELQTFEIKGHDDFELDIGRNSLLKYHVALNSKKDPEGTVFIIPGFGNDSLVNYQKNLIQYITEKYNVMTIFVEYHALFARKSKDRESASYQFGQNDIEPLLKSIEQIGLKLNDNDLSFSSIVDQISAHMTQLKNSNQVKSDAVVNLWSTLFPYKNEYQNFGILQALDILTVLHDIKKKGYEKLLLEHNIVAFGSSHGGYLANLLMKIAPNTFDVIVDNSSYVKPPLNFIVGFENNPLKPEHMLVIDKNIAMYSFTLTFWTLKKGDPNEFTKSAYEIRDLTNNSHMDQLSKETKTKLITYHSVYDKIASYKDKEDYCKYLLEKGVEVELHTIKDESQLDGKFIKNLDHAMGMSIKQLVDIHLSNILTKEKKYLETDLSLETTISYQTSDNKKYQFKNKKGKVSAFLNLI